MADITYDTDLNENEGNPPSPSISPNNPIGWNATLGGYLGNLSGSAFTPEQRAQLAQTSMQLVQNAANHAMKQQSPLRKVGNVLRGLGGAVSGIAPGGSGLTGLANSMIMNARQSQDAEDRQIVNQLKMAQQTAQMGMDPKMISQIIKGYDVGGKQALGVQKNAISQQRADTADLLAQTKYRLATGQLNLWKQQGVHWDNLDKETKRNHDLINERETWARNSLNTIAANNQKLEQYQLRIQAGKASADDLHKGQELQEKIANDIRNYNLGVDKINMHSQRELMRTSKGKPVYVDANGNVPTYTPIPHIGESQGLQANEYQQMPAFPEAAEAQALGGEAPQMAPMPQQPQQQQQSQQQKQMQAPPQALQYYHNITGKQKPYFRAKFIEKYGYDPGA